MKLFGKFPAHANSISIGLLYLAYFCTFVISAVLTFIFVGDPLIITAGFLIFLAISASINTHYIKHIHQGNIHIELQNQALENLLNYNMLFSILLNQKNEIVSCKYQKLVDFEVDSIANLEDVELFFQKLLTDQDKQQIIKKFIYEPSYESSERIIGPLIYADKKVCIHLTNIKSPDDYKFIKIYEQSYLKNNTEITNQLALGYYELDKYGFILEINEYFARMLGISKTELQSGQIQLRSFINQSDSMNMLYMDTKNSETIRSNWQGFVTFNSKFKEKVPTFVMHKAIHNEYNDVSKIIGYALKIQDSTLALKSSGVEKGWLDYSWRSFFEDSPYPTAILDKKENVIRINNAFNELLPESFINRAFREVFTFDDQQAIKEHINDLLSKKAMLKPLKNLHVNNSNRILDINIGAILDVSGDIFGFLVQVADLTQQKELEANLSHSQRMQTIGHLVGSVAHDFNNLLTAIAGFCDLLLMRHHVGDPSFMHIMQIKQSSDRASNLVRRLLAFSRKQTLKLQAVDLNELFSDFFNVIQRLIGNDVTFSQAISPDIWTVKIDPVQMEQVVLNLAVNAHHAMSNGGKLTVRAHNVTLVENDPAILGYIAPAGESLPPPGEYVALEVEDTGSGILPELMQKIFEPFFTTKTEKSGTGLGLSTVYGIIRQSEGYIYVRSKIGSGTTFLIYLKRYQATKEEIQELQKQIIAAESEDAADKQDLSGKGTIVLVEDEESVRLFAKNVLVSKGYNVIEFPSAKHALLSIKTYINMVDLIVSDVVMPEMTGPNMVTEIKKIKPDIKVIFISGFGEEAFTEEYGKERNFHFIAKPFSLKQLVIKVKEVLSK